MPGCPVVIILIPGDDFEPTVGDAVDDPSVVVGGRFIVLST
jgi:hypothetical protein